MKFVALVAISTTLAKRHLDDTMEQIRVPIENHDVKEASGVVFSPLVEAKDCESMCLFKDPFNDFCWKLQGPILEAGYDWKQSTSTNYWQM